MNILRVWLLFCVSFFSLEASAMRPAEIFKRADTDHDGYVSMEENEKLVPVMFSEYDENKDGLIDRDEMFKWMSLHVRDHEGEVMKLPAAAITVADRSIKLKDSDKDGKISYEEFLADVKRSAAKMDKDSDGRLSFEEMTVFDPPPKPATN